MLRMKIDGNWEPEDFIALMKATESLYYKALPRSYRYHLHEFLFLERRRAFYSYEEQLDATNRYLLAESRNSVPGHSRILVRRVDYASPGKVDLIGIGEAFKSVEGIVDRLIKFFTERNLRKERDKQARLETLIKEIEAEKQHETLKSLQIENARELLRLRREFPEELENMIVPLAVRDQERLTDLISQEKLIGVKRSDKKDDSE
ncbi:MAG: hypothetical protein AAF292_17565 [Pseudomonadota bacterium]